MSDEQRDVGFAEGFSRMADDMHWLAPILALIAAFVFVAAKVIDLLAAQ